MDSTLLLLLTVFVGLTTLSMVAQAIALLGMARIAKQLQEKVNGLLPQITKTIDSAHTVATETSRVVTEVGQRANEILDLTKVQAHKIDAFVTETTSRAKAQVQRAELVLDDTMGRTQHTVALVQRGIISPIREVHGVMSGFRAALLALGRGTRSTVDHATSDEEMFI